MKKLFYILTVSLVSIQVASAQSWTIYNADVDPTAFDPEFSTSNTSGTYAFGIVEDDFFPNNSLLSMTTDDDLGTGNLQLRQYTDEDAVTVVIKARTVDQGNNGLLFDMDFESTLSPRFTIRVLNDGTYDIVNGGDGVVADMGDWSINTTEWNIFRFTKEAGLVNIYINEDPTPIFTITAPGGADGSGYWRFGDGTSSEYIDTQIDWIMWDYTGAYTPTFQPVPVSFTSLPLGDWTTYNADVDPTAFDPEFSTSNTSGTYAFNTLVDPDLASNNLLSMTTDDDLGTGNLQLRQYTDEDAVTVVLKARTADQPNNGLLFDMDFESALSPRFTIRILNDGTYDIVNGGDGVVADMGDWSITTTDWNIFRFTKEAGLVNIYINEDPTPIFTITAPGGADGSGYWRFGDGTSSEYIDTQIDWITWDYSGAYSPEQTRLPNDLVKPPLGEWTVYNADVDPTAFNPQFSTSNTSGTYAFNTLADPDLSGNNLLSMTTDDDLGTGNLQLRQYTDEDAITVVLKARTVDLPNNGLLFDMDFESTLSPRFTIRVLNDGTYDIVNGGDGVVADMGDWSIATTDWNIFRFTKDAGLVNVYINEDPTPIFTITAPGGADGSGYWRFGDGTSSEYIDTQIDWITWDYTGAFSPEETRLPGDLTGDVVDNVPTISTLGTPEALFQDLGFASDFSVETYTVIGSDLVNDLTITPPVNFEVSINEVDWFTNASPLVIPPTNGAVEETIYVRLNATEVGEYSGDISHTSDDADEVVVAVSGSTVDLVPEISLTGSLDSFIKNISSPAVSQNYRVSGENLKGSITVTAPTNFQVSADDATWGSSVVLDPEDRTVSNVLVYVRINASSIGDYAGNISHASTDAEEVSLAIAGQVVPDPGINVSSDFTAFSQGLGTPSEPQTYTVGGSNLASGISISLPEGYEVSFTGDVWLPSLTLAPLSGVVETITLYIRLNALAEGSYSGDILHTSNGVDDVSVSISGSTSGDVALAVSDQTDISVYPNPSTNFITIKAKESANDAKVSLFTLKGSLVGAYSFEQGKSELNIDIQSLDAGIYLLEYTDSERLVKQKIIKN